MKVYILSDTVKLSKYSNIPVLKHKTDRQISKKYVLPTFTHKESVEYLKSKTKHPYHIIMVNLSDLNEHMCDNTSITVVDRVYCSLDDGKEYYDELNL